MPKQMPSNDHSAGGGQAPEGVDDYQWRWSREGVQQRIQSMTPADALLTIEQYNIRHFREPAMHLDRDSCLRDLTPAEAETIRSNVAALRESATSWGMIYWKRRLREAGHGGASSADDSEIIAEMSARHPGFSEESLTEIYHTGIMLAR